ncbi:hypothetical protein M2336_001874 [Sphingobium sp. B1D7B]|uniref:GPO family capsid scaffolding protein n=1 Tax=unclassified Sphingobium TaxID=2611147 RepID=UPI002223F3A7|nr:MULTISPECIES: GPO family capsid scaffolding protein [unclassified Sphingobium]MCW2395195.1 hypothetical protein [Sphingobium sp. B8D3B]MCW2405245.1 hypothetical protein [Sphingobium sp. B1D7B]MCW2418709.1 hypothetical protein [Sphingobium sp. B8D3C]
MAKTKFFRVAVEGQTVDNRAISRQMIQEMADSYNPATYAARINCEHLRGYSPDGPFNAWGTVDGVKAEQIDLQIGGKTEKRLALFASFDVTDEAQRYNQAGQKLFSSVEIQPDFAGTGKAYLVGLAFTDSPASLGTEVLKFSTRDDKRKDNLCQIEEFEMAYAEEAPTPGGLADLFSSAKAFFESFKAAPATAEVVPPVSPAPAGAALTDLDKFAATMAGMFEKMGEGVTQGFTAINARVAKLAEDQAALASTIEKTPSQSYRSREPASGGTGELLADF